MVIFGLCSAQLVLAADLSLQIWNSTDGQHVEDLQRNPFPPLAGTIPGNSAILCDTGSPIAVYVGMDALKKGWQCR